MQSGKGIRRKTTCNTEQRATESLYQGFIGKYNKLQNKGVLTQFKSLCNKMMESNADVISHLEGLVKSDKETRGQIELLLEGANEMVCFLNHLQSPQKVPLDYNQRSARSYLGRSLKLTSCFTFR